MQHHAADQLHVEVPHVEHAASGFANHGKSFLENFVEDLAATAALVLNLFLAVGSASGSSGIGLSRSWMRARNSSVLARSWSSESFSISGSSALIACNARHQPLDFAFVLGPENLA